MSKPNASPVAADTSEDKDDEEMVALLPPSAEKADGPSNAASLRRTPGPNTMKRNEHEEDIHRRTPLVSNSRRNGGKPHQRQLYTPAHFTLSKNPHLHMDGSRPEVFSPNTIRMTDSLDKLLRDDDDDDDALNTGAGGSTPVVASPQPLKFDGNRGGGAFEPTKPSAIKRFPGPQVDVTAPTGEGSLHTPKPQRVAGARYAREETMMHHPHHLGHYDHYSNHRVQQQYVHDPFFTPLMEDPYRDMHQYGPIPPTVISPLTIPEYTAYPPMHAASWSPIPPEFGPNLMGGSGHHWGQQPQPAEYHPHNAAYDRHYQQMPVPHQPHYHLPGNVSPFMPHYTSQYQHTYQQSAPLSPRAETGKQYNQSNEHSPHGRPRKDSSASVNSGHSSKSVENTIYPQYRQGLQSNSSEEELNWFVPHAISGETVSRGGQSHGYQQSSLQARSIGYSSQLDKNQVKKGNVKQSKETRHAQVTQQNKSFHAKGLRASTAAANSAANQEFIESPQERAVFKEFGRQFRQKETLDAAKDYAVACLSKSNPDVYLPPSTHWRVYLELADLAKRCNEIDNARSYYRTACKLQPLASQGWMEHSKLEEESGNLNKCAIILEEGLRYCNANENLLIRAIKFRERVGQVDQARQLLGRLKQLPIEKYWKVMMEGALLEARAGKYMAVAREILKYLTHYVSWYGPLYLAHTKLERDYGTVSDAFAIVEKGLKELPRYGPLYFQAFSLLEKEDLSRNAYDLPRITKMVTRADNNISRELLWKVHLEAAQIQERAAAQQVLNNPKMNLSDCLDRTRKSYAKSMTLCPTNLCWKIWLASGRTEVSCGNIDDARVLFLRAYESVSEKGRSTVLLECARLEELCEDFKLTRAILSKARVEFGKSDWKVWLASINLECRCGQIERAIEFAKTSLKIHSGTGRLWASLIQLRHEFGEVEQEKILKSALQAVPKSGEVWCEGARIHLNPFSPTFDLHAAGRHLSFAAKFTPQYGDSFLEQLRLHLIDQCIIPVSEPFVNSMHTAFLAHGKMALTEAYSFISEQVKQVADVMKTQLNESYDLAKFLHVLDTTELELSCSSADPNYGQIWFQCRHSPIDTAIEVVNRAKSMLATDVVRYSYVYIAAIVRRAGILCLLNHHKDVIVSSNNSESSELPSNGVPSPNSNDWDLTVNEQLRKAPSLNEMLGKNGQENNILSSQMFITAHVESNKRWNQLTSSEKQRILFGSDSLLS